MRLTGEDTSETHRVAIDMARVWRDNQRALFALVSTNLTECAKISNFSERRVKFKTD